MYKFSLIGLLIATFISGCGILIPREGQEEIPVEQRARLIKAVAREATMLAIIKIYEENQVDQNEAANDLLTRLNTSILPVLQNPDAKITHVIETELLMQIPLEYRGVLAIALETLRLYYTFPEEIEFLTADQVLLLSSFFEGIGAGAQNVLVVNGGE